MTLYMCFIETLVLASIVSEILASIYHKKPNCSFLTLKMTIIVIPHLSYIRTKIAFTPKKLHDAINLGSTLNNIDNYGKKGQI